MLYTENVAGPLGFEPRTSGSAGFRENYVSLSVLIRTRLRALFVVCGRLVKELLGTR